MVKDAMTSPREYKDTTRQRGESAWQASPWARADIKSKLESDRTLSPSFCRCVSLFSLLFQEFAQQRDPTVYEVYTKPETSPSRTRGLMMGGCPTGSAQNHELDYKIRWTKAHLADIF